MSCCDPGQELTFDADAAPLSSFASGKIGILFWIESMSGCPHFDVGRPFDGAQLKQIQDADPTVGKTMISASSNHWAEHVLPSTMKS
jgi:hypothetical protein